MRKAAGVYYTPVEVVRCQVRLVDRLLRERMGKPAGFAEDNVVTLDPATGTGTYLLAIVERAAEQALSREGQGMVAGRVSTLADQLYAFEWLVGPYAVAELRLSQQIRDHGAALPEGGPHVMLTNALESPFNKEPDLNLFGGLDQLARQRREALDLKRRRGVLVCLGNPPYDRHESTEKKLDRGATGDWVRHGREDEADARPVFEDWVEAAKAAGHGGDVKNLYNLYAYFWRWAVWKVFQFDPAVGGDSRGSDAPGVVCFITASSFLEGTAFVGLRESLRRECDAVWVLDLGGDGLGTRKEENVFAIRTPVCVTLAARFDAPRRDTPADVRYRRVREPDTAAKLAAVDAVNDLDGPEWRPCPEDWHAPFKPAGVGPYFDWPLLTDVFPWQQSGVEAKRSWPIAVSQNVLVMRWDILRTSSQKAPLYKESGTDGSVDRVYPTIAGTRGHEIPIKSIRPETTSPSVRDYAYRAFDYQQVFVDGRLLARPRPPLWDAISNKQVHFATVTTDAVGFGPSISCAAHVPDRHYFCGRGGKDLMPLYRDAAASDANMPDGLTGALSERYGVPVTERDVAAYVYGLLCNPAYTERFFAELETREIRIPWTADAGLFARVRDEGGRLIWVHTYGQRFADFAPDDANPADGFQGEARCEAAVPQDQPLPHWADVTYDGESTLHVGGGRFAPVPPASWEYAVSGYEVLPKWVRNRCADPGGRKSSPLDDIRPESWSPTFSGDLLKLLWLLEYTHAAHARQAALLEEVYNGPLLSAADFPTPRPEDRAAPRVARPSKQAEFDM